MMISRTSLSVLALVAMACGTAHGATDFTYVGGSLGYASSVASDCSNGKACGVSGKAGLKVFGGWSSPAVGGELSVFSVGRVGLSSQSGELLGLSGVAAHAVLPWSWDALTVRAKAGVGRVVTTTPEADRCVTPTASSAGGCANGGSGERASVELLLGATLAYAISPHWTVQVDWDRYRGKTRVGAATVQLLSFGANYRF